MRKVISFSLPEQMEKHLKMQAKARGHASISGYVQYLITLDSDSMPEAELVKAVEEARQDYKIGKTVTASSIADL